MPLVTRSSDAGYDTTTAMRSSLIVDFKAMAAIPLSGTPLTLTATGWRPATSADPVHGWSSADALIGEPVTAYGNAVRFYYSATALTPGQPLYLSATAGVLSTDVPGSGTTVPVAFVVSNGDIMSGGVL